MILKDICRGISKRKQLCGDFFYFQENEIEGFTLSSSFFKVKEIQGSMGLVFKDAFECDYYPNRNQCFFQLIFLSSKLGYIVSKIYNPRCEIQRYVILSITKHKKLFFFKKG